MAYTFHIREPYGRPYVVRGSEDAARPGDLSLDFDLPFYTVVQGAEAVEDALNRIASDLRFITKVTVKPGLKGVYLDSKKGLLSLGFGALALVSFVGCAWFLYSCNKEHPTWSFVIAAVWTVCVPIYFYCEHEFYFYYFGNPAEFEQFKRIQDLAAKIWVGAISVLGAILAVNNSIPHISGSGG